jgi:hypothetical protein
MASYNNANYKNDFFNLNGLYFNSTIQTNSTTLDEKYLQKSGGTINGSLDIKTNLTLPIGDIGTLINDLQEDIDLKQSKLSAGTNVTISSNNIISSTDPKKQNLLTFFDSLVLNSIVVKPAVSKLIYTPAISGEIKATTLTIEDPFTLESINVKDTLNSKQNILIPGENISIIDNVISLIGGITQADLDLKQNFINDGDLSFAKTSGLQTAINNKQDKLTAGNNITIVNNVISSTSSTSGTSVVFIASRAGTHFITNNTIVPFNIEVLNTGGGYSGSTYKFTAPIAGAYHFNMSIDRVAGKVGSCDIRYYNGSTDVIKQQIGIANATPNNYFMDLTIYCNVGDQVYCKTNGSLNTEQLQINASTYFSGFLIR